MAAGGTVSVQVYGLREFRTALLAMDRRLPDMVDAAARDAAELVAKGARKDVPIGPGAGGHARSTIKALRRGDGWSVQGGGPGFPYYPWLDFGGSINKHTSKPTRRPFFKKGRYVYPSFTRNQPRIKRVMEDALRRYAESAGLDVT